MVGAHTAVYPKSHRGRNEKRNTRLHRRRIHCNNWGLKIRFKVANHKPKIHPRKLMIELIGYGLYKKETSHSQSDGSKCN